MIDSLERAIENKQLTNENISFDMVRFIAGQDLDLRHTLGYGRNIPNTVDQLNQYLYSYGPMVRAQWDAVLYSLCQDAWGDCLTQAAKDSVPVCIADYACGQGLASVLLREAIPALNVVHSELIEPSEVGLKRAENLVRCCYPDARVNCTNKCFGDIQVGDVQLADEHFKIHLFSNILDLEDVDLGITSIKRRSEGLMKFAKTYRTLNQVSQVNRSKIFVDELFKNISNLLKPSLIMVKGFAPFNSFKIN